MRLTDILAHPRSRGGVRAFGAALALAAVAFAGARGSAEEARVIPPPAAVETPAAGTTEVAVLAGGCFWGVQGVFQHVKGVTSAVSGYAGGAAETAKYDAIGTGRTGHAEVVKVTFDPSKISYGKILQIYFSVAHDPTTLNRQGPDSGTQYRSAIFPSTPAQAQAAKAYIAQLDSAKVFDGPIVTKIESGHKFYAAEDYHQDFMAQNPTYPYIVINDAPKVESLKRLFADAYRSKPVLVAEGHTVELSR